MDSSPLVTEQIDAGRRFISEFARRFPIKAAFWLKESEESKWNLYVSSEKFDDASIAHAHEEMARLLVNMNDPHLSLFRVRLLRVDDPRAKAVLEVRSRHPDAGAIHRSDSAMYIYPPLGEREFHVDMELGESFTVSGHFQDALSAALRRWRAKNGGRWESAIEIPRADHNDRPLHWDVYVVDAVNQPSIRLCRITQQRI